jgi:hypothetical protein
MISKITEYIIYESPDGGETVYARRNGSNIRELYSISDEQKEKIQSIKENQLWHNIRVAARTNTALQSALDQCIMLYRLSENNENGI